jgi:hypothetical protein
MSAVYDHDELETRLNGIISSRDLHGDGAASDSIFADLDSDRAPAGDVVIAAGERLDGVLVLLSGQVTVSCTGRRDFALKASGDDRPLFGVFEWLQGSTFHIEVAAAADCETAFVKGDKFLNMLTAHPDVCVRLAAAAGRAYTAAVKALRDGKEGYNS